MAAIMRVKSRLSLSSPAPPPSPIPNMKGPRSAVDNPTAFSDYLEKTKNASIPDLNLPEYVNRSIVADVDLRLLRERDGESVHGMIRSAVKFGVFRITGHGISAAEMQSTFEEVDSGFGFLTQRWRRDGDREEFVWSRSAVAVAERRIDVSRDEEFQRFSRKMENVASKLERIAEVVAQIIASNGNKGPLAFQTGPEAVVVTLGEQLEEWSLGEFKSAFGEINIEPDPQAQVASQASYSIELRCSPPTFNQIAERLSNTIYVSDQILIVVVFVLLYKLFEMMFP